MLVRLIVVNAVIFFILAFLAVLERLGTGAAARISFFETHFLYWPSEPLRALTHIYTLLTYQFLHKGFWHILFNMVMLWFSGRIFLDLMSERKLLSTYLMGGIAGALVFSLAMNLVPLFSGGGNHTLVGASASILAILVAVATLAPNYTVHLIIIGPVRLVYVAVAVVALDLLMLSGDNAGGHFSHLGGALYGFAYIRLQQKGRDLGKPMDNLQEWLSRKWAPSTKNVKLSKKVVPPRGSFANQEQIDAILDKISTNGYDSLTQKEKDILFKTSKNE